MKSAIEQHIFSDMDGIGSPDSLMDHSMLDIKGSSPYSCYSTPKLPYDSMFPTNRGLYKIHVQHDE